MCLKTSPSFSIPLQSSHWGYGGHRDDHDDDRDDHRDNHGNEDIFHFPSSDPCTDSHHRYDRDNMAIWQYGICICIWHMAYDNLATMKIKAHWSFFRPGRDRPDPKRESLLQVKKIIFFLKMFKKWLQALSSNIFKKDLTMFSSQNIVIKFLCRWHFWQLWC